jgi:hypothetical protein
MSANPATIAKLARKVENAPEFEPSDLSPLPLPDALKRAERMLTPDPQASGIRYPLDALGPLADAARALADGVQVQPAMAGQSLLAASALLVQSVKNVRTLDGAAKPLSVYALTVVASGDGKDAADRVALRRVHEFQREESRKYAAAQSERERTEATRKRGEAPPEPLPPAPYRIAGDVTLEGLRRSFAEGVASQGAFSTEAGVILAGHAMSVENRTKTAAALCGLWDRGHLSVIRGGAGRVERYGVRLSAHLLVQPAALGDVLADESLSGVGFWPRFLLAWPAPLAPRVYRPWHADSCSPIKAFWDRCDGLLQAHVPDDCDSLPALELGGEAKRGMAAFFERMEREGRRGDLRDVRPFALRATELACRVAGVLVAFDCRDAIDAETARNACSLVGYSLDAWRDAKAGQADPVHGWALTLYRWLVQHPEGVALREIPRVGPLSVRPAARRDAALERLQALKLADVTDGRAVALGVDHASD